MYFVRSLPRSVNKQIRPPHRINKNKSLAICSFQKAKSNRTQGPGGRDINADDQVN